VVFSSTPAHAKRGVLFSTFPDNQAMGEHLLRMVNELHHAVPLKARIEPLKSLQLAVNLRTAARLGIRYEPDQLASFSLTFR
jgi:putative ABC transport system substrate-binding protein